MMSLRLAIKYNVPIVTAIRQKLISIMEHIDTYRDHA